MPRALSKIWKEFSETAAGSAKHLADDVDQGGLGPAVSQFGDELLSNPTVQKTAGAITRKAGAVAGYGFIGSVVGGGIDQAMGNEAGTMGTLGGLGGAVFGATLGGRTAWGEMTESIGRLASGGRKARAMMNAEPKTSSTADLLASRKINASVSRRSGTANAFEWQNNSLEVGEARFTRGADPDVALNGAGQARRGNRNPPRELTPEHQFGGI